MPFSQVTELPGILNTLKKIDVAVVIRLKRIYNFLCPMLVFTPFS
jgi:hypothetical protein